MRKAEASAFLTWNVLTANACGFSIQLAVNMSESRSFSYSYVISATMSNWRSHISAIIS